MLTFIKELQNRSKDKHILWECLCSCGNVSVYRATHVRTNKVYQCKTCSFESMRNKNKTHGMKYTKEYRTWASLKNRCLNNKAKDFYRYGGNNISIEKDWEKSFELFYNHVGPCPSPKHSIDRINNSKGYVYGNVRWATPEEQQRNRSVSVYVTDGNNVFHIKEIADKLGISRGAAHLRLKRGKLNGYSRFTRVV